MLTLRLVDEADTVWRSGPGHALELDPGPDPVGAEGSWRACVSGQVAASLSV